MRNTLRIIGSYRHVALALCLSLGCVGGGDMPDKGDDGTIVLADFRAPDLGPVDTATPDVGNDSFVEDVTDNGLPDLIQEIQLDVGPTLPDCNTFCATYVDACANVEASGVLPYYDTVEQCLAICEGVGWAEGTLDDVAVNTIGCRLRTLLEDGPSVACKAGAPDGGGHCGTPCKNYCALSIALCTGDDAVYGAEGECLGYCASMDDDGAAGVALGDTVQCRIETLLNLVVTEEAQPGAYCPKAGPEPLGDCALEPNCQSYCDTVMAACPADGEYAQYDSVDACLSFCSTDAQFDLGSFSTDNKYSVGCRMVAASKAIQAPASFCEMAGPTGAGSCGTWCDNYCHLALNVCKDASVLFSNIGECYAACPTVAANGAFGDEKGDTIQCRYTLLHQAATGKADKGSSCAQASPFATDTCFTPPVAPTCEEYCNDVIAACGQGLDPNAQYESAAACLAFCSHEEVMPEGFGDDPSGNTRGCRAAHAKLTLESPENAPLLCPIAGPSGGNICGNLTDNYCLMAQEQCTGIEAIYDSTEQCLAIAQALPGLIPPEGEGSNDLACRIQELITGIATGQPGFGCTDGSFLSSICIGPLDCDQYCAMVAAGCGSVEGASPFSNNDLCMAYCFAEPHPIGEMNDKQVATIGCRYFQAKTAVVLGAEVGCDAAGPTGGGVCGNSCESYCGLAKALCQGENILYPDPETCLADCATLPQVGDESTLYGNSVQCRMNHLATGYQGVDPALACAEGSFGGGEQCAEGAAPPPTTYVEHVKPIFAARCTPCHGVGSPEPGSCSGGACFTSVFEDLLEPSYYCPGKTKGACTLERILDGSMPLVGVSPNEDEIGIIQTWLLDGMFEQ